MHKNNKLTSEEKKIRLAEFNKMYRAAVGRQKEITKKLKQLQREAREVNELAERAYWYANNNLFYDTERGIECVNKRTINRTEYLDCLRGFSYSIGID